MSEIAILGGGCFWCLEAVFDELEGVESVESGYAGGTVPNPTYKQVCGGATGHAETVKVEYDPSQISYDDLLEFHYAIQRPGWFERLVSSVGHEDQL